MKPVEELIQEVETGLEAMRQLRDLYFERAYMESITKSFPASSLPEPENYIKELLEMGERRDGPFTDEGIMSNPRISRATLGALRSYKGVDRFVTQMQKKIATGETLSVPQVRAVANILYKENKG